MEIYLTEFQKLIGESLFSAARQCDEASRIYKEVYKVQGEAVTLRGQLLRDIAGLCAGGVDDIRITCNRIHAERWAELIHKSSNIQVKREDREEREKEAKLTTAQEVLEDLIAKTHDWGHAVETLSEVFEKLFHSPTTGRTNLSRK